jgi:hypothetical protein
VVPQDGSTRRECQANYCCSEKAFPGEDKEHQLFLKFGG